MASCGSKNTEQEQKELDMVDSMLNKVNEGADTIVPEN